MSTHNQPMCLDDELWTIDHISTYLRKCKSAANKRAAGTGFPAPVDGSQRCRRWLATEVRAHFASKPVQAQTLVEVVRARGDKRNRPVRGAA